MTRSRDPAGRELGELGVGDEVFLIVTSAPRGRSLSGQRRTVLGAGRVRILERLGGEAYQVELVAFSGQPTSEPAARPGAIGRVTRAEVYDPRDRADARAFRAAVDGLWGPGVWRGESPGRRGRGRSGRGS